MKCNGTMMTTTAMRKGMPTTEASRSQPDRRVAFTHEISVGMSSLHVGYSACSPAISVSARHVRGSWRVSECMIEPWDVWYSRSVEHAYGVWHVDSEIVPARIRARIGGNSVDIRWGSDLGDTSRRDLGVHVGSRFSVERSSG